MIRVFAVASGLMLLLILAFTSCAAPLDPNNPNAGNLPSFENPTPNADAQASATQLSDVPQCEAIPNRAIFLATVTDTLAVLNEPQYQSIRILSTFTLPISLTEQIAPDAIDNNLAVSLIAGSNLDELTFDYSQREKPPSSLVIPDYILTSIEVQGLSKTKGFSPSHSPFGDAPFPITDTQFTADDFKDQWAFQQIQKTALYAKYGSNGGQGVDIAIFDTVPYTRDYEPEMRDALFVPKHISESVPISVHYADINGPGIDHGLFVASLAHTVAPSATVSLYRALNEDGVGDLASFIQLLTQFYNDRVMEHYKKAPQEPLKIVANFSLSVSCPDVGEHAKLQRALEFLHKIFIAMHDAGIVSISAAGNDGYGALSAHSGRVPQSFPANMDEVIGVGATSVTAPGDSDSNPQATCYSNRADLYLPVGGGVITTVDSAGIPTTTTEANGAILACVPNYAECGNAPFGQCPKGIVGLSTNEDSGLAYWSGTSFAAPLASGLAALMLASDDVPIVVARVTPIPGEPGEPIADAAVVKVDMIRDQLTGRPNSAFEQPDPPYVISVSAKTPDGQDEEIHVLAPQP